MTATEELRALLGAHGVEWTAHDNAWVNETYWKDASRKPVWASERAVTVGNIAPNGLVQKRHMTPAQAVEATLGRGTCKNVHEPPRNTTFWPAPHFKCSECGMTHVSTDYVFFCPNCGSEVDG